MYLSVKLSILLTFKLLTFYFQTFNCIKIKKSIQIESNQLEYLIFNESSSITLLCFHGFGQEANDFKKLANQHKTYRIIAINLFFHQGSYLNPVLTIQPNDWKLYLNKIIQEESIDKFSIMGYSMGGRFALTTLSLLPQQVDNLYLIAPDGLVEGRWFKFATGSKIQRLIFKSVLNSFPIFLLIAKTLSKTGLLNKGLLKFAQVHLQSNEERKRVYNTWTSFRLLKLSPKKLHKITTAHKIKTSIILGNYDRVIPIKRIEPKLIKSPYLTVDKLTISHHKLFYYNFLDRA